MAKKSTYITNRSLQIPLLVGTLLVFGAVVTKVFIVQPDRSVAPEKSKAAGTQCQTTLYLPTPTPVPPTATPTPPQSTPTPPLPTPTPAPPTPTPNANCCTPELLSKGYQCIENCPPPIQGPNDPPPGYSCLSPEEIASRNRHGCPICLSDTTLIDTPTGTIKITDLAKGDIVYSTDLFGNKIAVPVQEISKTPVTNHSVYHLVLADGRRLDVSAGHPLANGKGVETLHPQDSLDGSIVLSNTRIPYTGSATYDLLPDSATGTYWANGILMGSTLGR